MIEVGRPMVDWLTLTTFNSRLMSEIGLKIENYKMVGTWAPEKRMQYEGVVRAGAFMGQAVQRGRKHYMFQASGSAADTWMFVWNARAGAKCTRIDFQITIDCPRDYRARDYYDRLVEEKEHLNRKTVSIIQSGDGFDTIYIGARTSDRFIRLYIKPSGEGKVLRFEVEYKGERAEHAHSQSLVDRKLIGSYLRHELDMIPTDDTIERFRLICGPAAAPFPAKKRPSGNKTMRWMHNAVTPAIRRMLNDHEEQEGMRKIIREWGRLLDEPEGQG